MVQWFVPGPVPVTQKTQAACAGEMVSHRSTAFRELYAECTLRLQRVFQTKGIIFSITGSGTLANEAAVANLLPDTKALFLVNGEFGDRFYQAAKVYNPDAQIFTVDDGLGLNVARVKDAIDEKKPDWVCMVHNETATGVTNDVRGIAAYAKKAGAKVLVDAVSSLGGIELDMDGWGIDACTSASQKSLCAPPGLGFVALNEAAMAHIEEQPRIPTYGLNLKTYKKFHLKNETPYTPALPTFYGLREALRELESEGLANRWLEHTAAAQKAREAVIESGFTNFAEAGFESETITAFLPGDARVDVIKKAMAALGIQIAGGQGKWKGKMLRIATIGPGEARNIDACTTALKKACTASDTAQSASAQHILQAGAAANKPEVLAA
ncbi:alanine--glyoxylate aminotransferase family protein [Candidatus Micrarchaeota archaeon]|nr:alanine--glyoxylate aminotransferase family protein [Candidatus Micrarchaeota archaeon]